MARRVSWANQNGFSSSTRLALVRVSSTSARLREVEVSINIASLPWLVVRRRCPY